MSILLRSPPSFLHERVSYKAGIGVAYRRLYGAGEHLDEIERLNSHSALALSPMFPCFLIEKFAMKFRRDL